jgi:hypothetical protein
MTATDPIAQLLAGRFPDPETRELLVAELHAVGVEISRRRESTHLGKAPRGD